MGVQALRHLFPFPINRQHPAITFDCCVWLTVTRCPIVRLLIKVLYLRYLKVYILTKQSFSNPIQAQYMLFPNKTTTSDAVRLC